MIIVRSDQVEQLIESENRVLGACDSIFIDKAVVHASFNTGDEIRKTQVVFGPAMGEGGDQIRRHGRRGAMEFASLSRQRRR